MATARVVTRACNAMGARFGASAVEGARKSSRLVDSGSQGACKSSDAVDNGGDGRCGSQLKGEESEGEGGKEKGREGMRGDLQRMSVCLAKRFFLSLHLS